VAGDGLDIMMLASELRSDNPKRENVGVALAMVLGVTLLDFIGAQGVTSRHSAIAAGGATIAIEADFPRDCRCCSRRRPQGF
jgi:hypothetical protein